MLQIMLSPSPRHLLSALLLGALAVPYAAQAQSVTSTTTTQSAVARAEAAWSETAKADAAKSDWSVALGVASGFAPRYEGGKKLRGVGAPIIDVTWKDRVFLSTTMGLGAYAFTSDSFRLGASIAPSNDRKERYGPKLRGMGKLDMSAQGRLFAAYTYQFLTLSATGTRDSKGTQGILGLEATLPVSERFSFSGGVSGTWANQKYMENFFGVTPLQSLRSGNAIYRPAGGLKSIDLSAGANYQLTSHWSVGVSSNFSFLRGDAKDSPIVEKKTQISTLANVIYRF